ncbi:hypothetical protein NM208_g10914 [Fusarium decemcellulare]|uniref:Uncharacterized protein n=1 Tax=Fusarium decemcellulare TaxID=57161 RepID=A0ACC1RWP7_9HYPO|nr:hypothetical protein NM208_g10914 [Fusarium decemcellulare]
MAALTKMDFLQNRPHALTLAEEQCIERLLVAYNEVMPHMRVRLAEHLARYVVERGVREGASLYDRPSTHPAYRPWVNKKKLYYPTWFVLAACYGPDYEELRALRREMSDLWDVDFPTDCVIYPQVSYHLQAPRYCGWESLLSYYS